MGLLVSDVPISFDPLQIHLTSLKIYRRFSLMYRVWPEMVSELMIAGYNRKL